MEQGRISTVQAVFLTITMIIATTLLGLPAFVATEAGRDGWISVFLSIPAGLFFAWLTVKLSSLFPGKTLIQYLEDIIGRWPGKILGLLYILYFAHICSGMIAEYGGFIADAFMPETPTALLLALGTAVGAYAIKMGLEVLARTNQIFFPLTFVSLILITVMVTPEMKIVRFLPLLEASAVNIFKGTLAPMAWLGEIIALAMIIPYLSKPEKALQITFISMLVVGFIFLLLVFTSLAVFGETVASMTYPFFNVVRAISFAQIIERPEPIIMSIWVTAGVMKVAFFYYIIVLGTAQLTGIKDYRPLVLPVGVILTALSMIFADNTLQAFDFIAHTWPFYALFSFEFALPLALLLVAWFRGKGVKNNG